MPHRAFKVEQTMILIQIVTYHKAKTLRIAKKKDIPTHPNADTMQNKHTKYSQKETDIVSNSDYDK